MREFVSQIQQVASTQRHVLIVGEYGTGKCRTARLIHNLDPEGERPFQIIRCHTQKAEDIYTILSDYALAPITRPKSINSLILDPRKLGTLFLEGLNFLPESLQYELLKIQSWDSSQKTSESLQNDSIKNPGKKIRLIISIDLKWNSLQRDSQTIQTLLQPLQPHLLLQPALRERKEDIPALMETILRSEIKPRYDIGCKRFSPRTYYYCISYSWPGNIPQLRNAVEHACLVSNDWIEPEDLPLSIQRHLIRTRNEKNESFYAAEKQLIINVFTESDSTQEAADRLGISLDVLNKKLKEYQLMDKKLFILYQSQIFIAESKPEILS